MSANETDCLAQLEAKLYADSQAEIPPWASDAVAYAPQCGEAAAPWLLQHVAQANRESFLALEALRIHFPGIWVSIPAERRAATYVNYLAIAHWFNVWGQPGEALSATSQALIDLGAIAIPLLVPLLDVQRPAPSYGSEEATLSRLLAYRVCDYAWSFITQIQGEAAPFPTNPEARDFIIEKLRQRLQKQ